VKDDRREGPQSLVVAWTLDGAPIGKMDVAILVIKINFAFGITQWSYSKEGGMKLLEDVGCASFRREEAWKWEGCCVGRLAGCIVCSPPPHGWGLSSVGCATVGQVRNSGRCCRSQLIFAGRGLA
jgi:hypothetical protein